ICRAALGRFKQFDAARLQRHRIDGEAVELLRVLGDGCSALCADILDDGGRSLCDILGSLRAAQAEELRELVREHRRCEIEAPPGHRSPGSVSGFMWSGLRFVGQAVPVSISVTSRHSTLSWTITSCAKTSVTAPPGGSAADAKRRSIRSSTAS